MKMIKICLAVTIASAVLFVMGCAKDKTKVQPTTMPAPQVYHGKLGVTPAMHDVNK